MSNSQYILLCPIYYGCRVWNFVLGSASILFNLFFECEFICTEVEPEIFLNIMVTFSFLLEYKVNGCLPIKEEKMVHHQAYTHHHLAWHETLELHELIAFQAIGLIKMKKAIGKVDCPTLKFIYVATIEGLETNLRELLQFIPAAPMYGEYRELRDDRAFYAGDLLAFAKTAVRNYAVAITETATPVLRRTLVKQLMKAIDTHERVFNYMYERGYYPAYDLNQLLMNDVRNANKAISMAYER
jgi:spore coat protein F